MDILDVLAHFWKQILICFLAFLAGSGEYVFTGFLSAAIYDECWVPPRETRKSKKQSQQSASESVDATYDADMEKGRMNEQDDDDDDGGNSIDVEKKGGCDTKVELHGPNTADWPMLWLVGLAYEFHFCASLDLIVSGEMDLAGFLLSLPPLFVPYRFYKGRIGRSVCFQGVWMVFCVYFGHPWLAGCIESVV